MTWYIVMVYFMVYSMLYSLVYQISYIIHGMLYTICIYLGISHLMVYHSVISHIRYITWYMPWYIGMVYHRVYIIPIWYGIYHTWYAIYHLYIQWYITVCWYITVWYIPCMWYHMVYTIPILWYHSPISHMVYHTCDMDHVVCDIPWYITWMVYTNCDISWYITPLTGIYQFWMVYTTTQPSRCNCFLHHHDFRHSSFKCSEASWQ